MPEPQTFQRLETKRRRPQKPERHDARKFIEPVRSQVREAFTNTSDSEHVARHFSATIRSTVDVWGAGHDAAIENHEAILGEYGVRIEAIERRLGMGRAVTATGRMALVARRTA